MRRAFLLLVFAVLVMTSLSASSATTRTKIGKIRVFQQNSVPGSVIKFGRADGGTFDGCTLDPSYVSNARPLLHVKTLEQADVLATLLAAKQSNFDVAVGYLVESTGRCFVRSLEIQ